MDIFLGFQAMNLWSVGFEYIAYDASDRVEYVARLEHAHVTTH
jgi:hypothetical protein